MDGKTRVALIPKYSLIYNIPKEKIIIFMLVVKDEDQLKQCCWLVTEGFSVEEVCDMVIYNKI